MMLRRFLCTTLARSIHERSLSIKAELRDKVLEKMFNEACQKYKDKSSGGGFFEPSEKILKEFEEANKALLRKYNAKDEAEMSEFPKFDFGDPKVDSVSDESDCEECAIREDSDETPCEGEKEDET